jgi:predicted nucleotidyltransferase
MSDTETVLARDITRDELIAELRALRPLFEQMAVTHMVLFGSRARQDNRLDSDADLMIEVDPNKKFSLVDLVGVGHVVEDHVGLYGNIFMRRSASPDILDEVRRDGVAVF